MYAPDPEDTGPSWVPVPKVSCLEDNVWVSTTISAVDAFQRSLPNKTHDMHELSRLLGFPAGSWFPLSQPKVPGGDLIPECHAPCGHVRLIPGGCSTGRLRRVLLLTHVNPPLSDLPPLSQQMRTWEPRLGPMTGLGGAAGAAAAGASSARTTSRLGRMAARTCPAHAPAFAGEALTSWTHQSWREN
jgi:hypothetical protein